jgi:hypothetical protein
MAGSGRQNADSGLIRALLNGATVADAARMAGISERTAWRRMADRQFQVALEAARGDMLTEVRDQLTRAGRQASETLVELLATATPPTVRLGAARAILELGAKVREQEELADRLAGIEERLASMTGEPVRRMSR